MKKIFLSSLIAWAFLFLASPLANATATILPQGSNEGVYDISKLSEKECGDLIDEFERDEGTTEELIAEESEYQDLVLACAIKSGKIKAWMIPYLARNILQFLIGIAGLISVLMIIVGAYYYISGSLSDDKSKGKNILTYAIGGLILTSISWILVNIILIALTS